LFRVDFLKDMGFPPNVVAIEKRPRRLRQGRFWNAQDVEVAAGRQRPTEMGVRREVVESAATVVSGAGGICVYLTPPNRSSILGQVVILARRASAVVALLALVVGNVAVCAGWQATPEARMACCVNGTTCPMHKSDSHEHSSKRVVSQAQADSCCAAAAQRHDSAAAGSTFTASGVIALVPVSVFTVPTGPIASQEWRALVPLPVSSTPKHLLLSVFLV